MKNLMPISLLVAGLIGLFGSADGDSNAGYHYMGSAKIMAQIGQAFAEAVHELMEGQDHE